MTTRRKLYAIIAYTLILGAGIYATRDVPSDEDISCPQDHYVHGYCADRIYEDGSYITEDGSSACIPHALCDDALDAWMADNP